MEQSTIDIKLIEDDDKIKIEHNKTVKIIEHQISSSNSSHVVTKRSKNRIIHINNNRTISSAN